MQKLVVKPDQLIKRRGKLGLIKVGVDLQGVKEWLTTRLGKEFAVSVFFRCQSPYFVVCKLLYIPAGGSQKGRYMHTINNDNNNCGFL